MELIRKVATSLPADVEDALKSAYTREAEGSRAKDALSVVLESARLSRHSLRPLCQDTGMPFFSVKLPAGLSSKDIKETIFEATRLATKKVPLRPNAVDPISDKNTGDNVGEGFPAVYFEESPDATLTIDLMLKGSGCENQGQTYKLPDEGLGAERDLDGVRKCVLDAVHRAQGRGCPPYTIGVGIGGSKEQVARLAKEQLFRRLSDKSAHDSVAQLEDRLLNEINRLGIGPLGLGGFSTALGVKIGVNHRHPASYFVDISFACWAMRRGRLLW
ncbi:MAG: fumarate hydratase [Thermodesulfovibrionales bacterium]|nr:fumarate hydratase [Thermodesulfovibrionales bacterium]